MRNYCSSIRNQITSKRNIFLCFSFISLFFFISCSEDPDTNPYSLGDVTGQVVELGNPLKTRYADGTQRVYARNVWDMYAYHGKIYFGGGNSSNNPPASNAGRADLWTFDPVSQKFAVEYTVDEEQIHLIREFDNELYLPGHDSRESWSLGNFYRLESGAWKKYRTIPNGVHVYDIYKYGNRLYAAIGPNGNSAIQVSSDNGLTWNNSGKTIIGSRIYTLVPLAGALYSNFNWIYCPGEMSDFVFLPQKDRPLFTAGINVGGETRMERAVVFNGRTVYIIGHTYNDHQYKPVALIRARGHSDISRLSLPEEALPRDILIKGEWLLVLASIRTGDEVYKNIVLATRNIDTDPVEWTTLFHFTAPAFARSFEYLNGKFYFGLGCDAEELTATTWLSPATGNILSVEYIDL
ncbi:hypothetical protein [Dysgonomonas gadei]|uniref:hypothetical protein n=1 Tax=Dysgonomonas gadei TaxID=156974 RepID=UPI003AF1273F